MATLNLRDRLLETKIAFVGAALAGKSANLDHLRVAGTARDAGAFLEWRPRHLGGFDDCELSAHLIEHEASDVDGVVLVIDSRATALEANRAAAATLRSRLSGRSVPVVVQLNKRDLPDAVEEAALVSALDVGDWPIVPAVATSGDGVLQTVERAIEGVLAMMKQSDVEVARGRASESNPLLSALRGVLEAAISEQIHALEERIHARISGRSTEVAELRQEVAALARSLGEVRQSVAEVNDALTDVNGGLSVVELRLAEARSLLENGCTKEDVDGSLQRHVEGLRKTSETQTTKLLSTIGKLGEGQDAVLGSLSPVSVEVTRIAATLGNLEPRLTRVVDDRAQKTVAAIDARTNAAVGARTTEVAAAVQAAAQRLDERTEVMAAQLDELVEELKKRKKGWFG